MVAERLSVLFKAVADPTRRRILERLGKGGLPVSEIAARFPMSRPAISKHLRILREAGLVIERRQGRQRVYQKRVERLEPLVGWLAGVGEESEGGPGPVETVEDGRRRPKPDAAAGQSKGEALDTPAEQDERQWRSW